ncbi:hypothetical protein [Poritiphilus flavus]|uniref:Uncharacterized protein n=1 Tax=Poritiphilus flavus TaxID=2697053 RepID=A0A6L9E830_9FLAO|nr:hypothetical protein [Poritiphilus flavus]NAS10753.1 hypothetical protein [Poritiphilus flavus]
MIRKYALYCFLTFTVGLCAQQGDEIPARKTQNGLFVIDFLPVEIPSTSASVTEDDMGLTGLHYNLDFNNFYTGLGIYGAVSGERGGFFTLGINAGYRAFLGQHFFLDAGVHFGGGGGAAAPDGGGAFILPHLSLGLNFNRFALTGGYSHINFFDGGKIRGEQLYLALQLPLKLQYASFADAGKSFAPGQLKSSTWDRKPRRMSFMLHLNNLSVQGDSQDILGVSLDDSTIRLAGFELNSYFGGNWLFFLKADGAYDGIPAGYMNILLGAGHHFSLNKNRTNILAKFGVGAGGGGGVDTQGGVLIYPDISLEQHLFSNLYLAVNKGFLMSPNSHFIASTLGFGLKYYSDFNGVKTDYELTRSRFKAFEIIVKQDVVLDADREMNPTENLFQISLQLNYLLSRNFYLAGQTSFANFGNAGAYAEGLVGPGLQTNYFMNNSVNLFAQVLGGGAGGGDISTGEGLVVKPSAGLNLKLSDQLALRAAAGYLTATNGDLSSVFGNLGLSYRLSFLNSR